MSSHRFESGVAVVTGASSGIGRAFAVALAARATSLVLAARSRETLDALAREIAATHSVRVEVAVCDLSTNDGPRLLEERVRALGMDVDLLVNNAGAGVYGGFGAKGPEREAEIVRLNVQAPVELGARFLPGMIARGRGAIMNIASTAAFKPVPWIGSYSATKAHLLSWTHALDVELGGTGVRAIVVCPGSTSTNFHRVSGASGQQRKNRLGQQTAEDVAREALEGLDRGQRVIVTGLLNRLHVALTAFVPDGLAARLAYGVMGPARRSKDSRV